MHKTPQHQNKYTELTFSVSLQCSTPSRHTPPRISEPPTSDLTMLTSPPSLLWVFCGRFTLYNVNTVFEHILGWWEGWTTSLMDQANLTTAKLWNRESGHVLLHTHGKVWWNRRIWPQRSFETENQDMYYYRQSHTQRNRANQSIKNKAVISHK